MPHKPDRDGNHAPTTVHYNVHCVGGIVFNRVTVRNIRQLRIDVIERIWIVEQRREATKAEIKKLCSWR
jgi:hypothetical protein